MRFFKDKSTLYSTPPHFDQCLPTPSLHLWNIWPLLPQLIEETDCIGLAPFRWHSGTGPGPPVTTARNSSMFPIPLIFGNHQDMGQARYSKINYWRYRGYTYDRHTNICLCVLVLTPNFGVDSLEISRFLHLSPQSSSTNWFET